MIFFKPEITRLNPVNINCEERSGAGDHYCFTKLSLMNKFILFFLVLTFQIVSISAFSQPKINPPTLLYGTASFYANKFQGRQTANGEIYNHSKYTAACNLVPLGTWIRVTNLLNKKSVLLKVNDRLHPKNKRIVDLSLTAAKELNYTNAGLAKVKVEVLGKNKPKK